MSEVTFEYNRRVLAILHQSESIFDVKSVSVQQSDSDTQLAHSRF